MNFILENKNKIYTIFFLSIFFNIFHPLSTLWLFSANGGESANIISFILVWPFLLAILVILVSTPALIFKKYRENAKLGVINGLIYCLVTFLCIQVSTSIRKNEFHELAIKTQPLIDSIIEYHKKEGAYPEALSALVPNYISKVPTTGIPVYPKYIYTLSTNKKEWSGNPWALYVNSPIGIINWDIFLYLPNENYPKVGYGGWLEKIDNWAYVHE